MGVLSDLEPKKVFAYFEEITRIPHGSGNVDAISNYLVDFAKSHGLSCVQDEYKNVILTKEASAGYENEPGIVLQGHMDMVAVKTPECPLDLKKDGLQVAVDGDHIYAQGTSLGGDDGIAVAYALAILDDDSIKHPHLEVIITTDEEVGMDGARGIDLSGLTGRRLVNLDSEEEGYFLTGCAGGARVRCHLWLESGSREGVAYEVVVKGLTGGHSGEEIDKGRANSNILFGRLLWELSKVMEISLATVDGGLADNAISRETKAVVVIPESDGEHFAGILDSIESDLQAEYRATDPLLQIAVHSLGKGEYSCAGVESTKRAAAFLHVVPNGIQRMNPDVQGLVQTSLNLGMLKGDEKEMSAVFAVRSSLKTEKENLYEQLAAATFLAGGTYEVTGEYPGWQYRVDSPLRDKMVAVYEKLYGKKPVVRAIHAGLECGMFADKLEDLDCVSIGPDMQGVHTTEEKLSISSTKHVWEYLLALLAEKDA